MLEILVRPERHERLGREAGRLGRQVAEALDVQELVHLLAGDFLFVQRAEHQQGGAGVFQRLGDVHFVAERPCADDQRMRQAHPEIGRAEVHYSSFFGSACSLPPGVAASKAGTLTPESCEYTEKRRSAAACDSATNAL